MGSCCGEPAFQGFDGNQENLYRARVSFFVVYYFLLPILVGYAPRLMAMKVWGNVNLAYLFALSQFFMAWMIAGLYVRAGDNFDRISKDIIDKVADLDFTGDQ